jgi:hypothetical protein
MFKVTLDVVDAGGPVTKIDRASPQAYCTVRVENITPLPKSLQVEVQLPNGMRRIEFKIAGSAAAFWQDATPAIAGHGGQALVDCKIDRNGGAPNHNEPIELIRLSQRPATSLSFQPVIDPTLPFQITIHAA